MRQALAAGDLAGFTALVRTAMGLSQLQFASLVGWSQSTVNRVENGTRHTLYDIRELLRFADAIDMPRHALTPLLLGSPLAVKDIEGVYGDMEMDRRHFAAVLAGGLATGVSWGSSSIPRRITPVQLRQLDAVVRRLYADDQRMGGRLLLPLALHQVTRVRRMLDEADYTEAIGRRLVSAAGALHLCAGWLAYDSGDHELARRLYGEAAMYAEQAGDDELRVNVASYRAMHAVRLARSRPGRAREALRAVLIGREAARRWATPRVHAVLAVREATAHAVLGDRTACRAALAAAWREVERGPHDDDPDWTAFITEPTLTYFEGLTTMTLGSPVRAADRFQRLLGEPAIGPRNRTYYHACLATALLASGAKSEALTEGLALLPHIGGSRRTLQELAPLRQAAGASSEFGHLYDRHLTDPIP
ncbi:helix-turn-helix domain-containing protein [Sphaerisporangium rufum]|uniref:helix-turn-helix domain-containing protein n=1 Tax=Sphaerisporangium rufum TaxID=1381558 RepID=UPI0019500E9C|nr:helix-turn-helix transcriptional regulator [Sphaerisporangium rufum]